MTSGTKMKKVILTVQKMALLVLLMVASSVAVLESSEEMALFNVTRFSTGDLFSLVGSDCGLTRCMEVSHGTALAALGGGGSCACQCRKETPTYREDQKTCVNSVLECSMARFGRGDSTPSIPFVFLPPKGQIVYPSKEIIFTDVEDAICAVTSAQYLSPSGWVALRDLVDNDVPFGLYRDEGSTYLQWRGSTNLHSRLEGRLVAVHVLCSAAKAAHLSTSCAAFRVAGVSRNTQLDVRSIPFHAGETVTSEPASNSQGLSVLEALAIGVCVLMLVFVYAAGIIFYIHYKQKQRRKFKDLEMNHSNTLSSENASSLDSRIDMGSMRMKSNPLLNLDGIRHDFMNDAGLSDVSEQTEDTLESSPKNVQKFQDRNSNVVSAMVHSRRKKPSRSTIRATSTPERLAERLQRRSASPEIEKAPHSDLSILDCSLATKSPENITSPISNGEPRRKLYFNPVFFEIDYLKQPPPEAIEFLEKLREVMSIAKEKMTSKRFIPMLSDIPEEERYHSIDLGWDIPCARRGRRFSAISLKRENSRRSIHCEGCPGCDNSEKAQKSNLLRSNSCKTCVSDDYKQRIVQKWLDDVPQISNVSKPTKSVAKVSGTPRVIESKDKEGSMTIHATEPTRNDNVLRIIEVTDDAHLDRNKIKKEKSNSISEKIETTPIKRTSDPKNEQTTAIATNSTEVLAPEKKSPPSRGTRIVRKRLPPPPPPPIDSIECDNTTINDMQPVPSEVKIKMEAVIRELNKCKRLELEQLSETNSTASTAIGSKLVIPVVGPDANYFSDDNLLLISRRKGSASRDNKEFSSIERILLKKRRYSLDQSSEIIKKEDRHTSNLQVSQNRLTRSWRDLQSVSDDIYVNTHAINMLVNNTETHSIKDYYSNSIEPIYNNIEQSGPLTIEVRGSPIENKCREYEDFDPDTLDRKPKKMQESQKCVEKILLKSGGSFKNKYTPCSDDQPRSPPDALFTRKIGSLRQIYEARTKAQESEMKLFYERRGSVPYGTQELASYVRNLEQSRRTEDLKPPLPPKQKRGPDIPRNSSMRVSPPSDRIRSSEERDRFPPYSRNDNLNARRSGRRSGRTRPRRVDLKKLCRTEDSGYLSTDSNESKHRTRYLMQLRPKIIPPEPQIKPVPMTKHLNLNIESDTDDFESLCDGRSESGGESIETDSVFFGHFNDSKQLLEELRIDEYDSHNLVHKQDQMDSGFVNREPNIILSGDSDSEHRSVISITAGRDGRASASSIHNFEDSPYVQSVEC